MQKCKKTIEEQLQLLDDFEKEIDDLTSQNYKFGEDLSEKDKKVEELEKRLKELQENADDYEELKKVKDKYKYKNGLDSYIIYLKESIKYKEEEIEYLRKKN